MTREDIDYRGSSIRFRHTKNNRPMSVIMPPQLKSALTAYERHRVDEDDVFMFPSDTGGMLTVNGLRSSIVRYNERRGVIKTSVHLFRHTHGKMWAENGGDVYTLQKNMGHSDIRTTQRYIDLYGGDFKNSNSIRYNPLETLKKE